MIEWGPGPGHAQRTQGLDLVTDTVRLTIGSRNVLNTYPDENPDPGRLGNRYPPSAPFGFSGGSYHVRLSYEWRTKG